MLSQQLRLRDHMITKAEMLMQRQERSSSVGSNEADDEKPLESRHSLERETDATKVTDNEAQSLELSEPEEIGKQRKLQTLKNLNLRIAKNRISKFQ